MAPKNGAAAVLGAGPRTSGRQAVLGGFPGQLAGEWHQLGVYGRELGLDGVGVGDEQHQVDRQVDESSLGGVAGEVWRSARVYQEQGVAERLIDLGDLVVGGGRKPLGDGLLSVEALLLGLQDLLGDAVVVVELQELLLLADEFAHAAGVALSVVASGLGAGLGVGQQYPADHGLLVRFEQVGLVLALNRSFDRLNREVWGCAASLPRDAAEAAEVLVEPAVASAAVVAEALAANVAVDRADQVVAVLVGAIAAGPVGRQDLLDLLEGFPVDDGVMTAGAPYALERHDPDVVVVPEHAVDHAAREGFARPLSRRPRPQSDILEDFGDGGNRVCAGSGKREAQSYEVDTVGVDADGRDLAALDRFGVVEVADARWSHAAAVGVLAGQSALDLLAIAP